jgi:hypothetical protein
MKHTYSVLLDAHTNMLFVLIAIGWLGIVSVFVALCQMARRGDAMGAPAPVAAVASIQLVGGSLLLYDNRPRFAASERRSRRTVQIASRRARTTERSPR